MLMKKKVLFILLGFLFVSAVTQAQDDKFKALFMYNFTKYIEWPANMKQGDFVIGVLGSSGMETELKTISERKKVNTQTIVVKKLNSAEGVEGCHMIYISPVKSSSTSQVSSKVTNCLLVSDNANGVSGGASINFIKPNDKLEFEISKSTIEKTGLKIGSGLMSLGKVVK